MATCIQFSSYLQGIQHAIQAWDVDIVSMSFAFEDNEPEIEDAIRKGSMYRSHKQVLFFAAASNNSTLKRTPISFPGRMTDSVICVFSSTINGQRSDFGQSLTGMKSVLRRCMTDEEHMNGNYHFLKPWQLLEFDDSDEIAIRIRSAVERDLGIARRAWR